MKVFVYFNLHKRLFSVKALEGPNKGRVIAHMESLVLDGAQFKVSQTGRARVIREQRKNVHAGVVGQLYTGTKDEREYPVSVTYDPYKHETFVDLNGGRPVVAANHVKLSVVVTSGGRAGVVKAVHAW